MKLFNRIIIFTVIIIFTIYIFLWNLFSVTYSALGTNSLKNQLISQIQFIPELLINRGISKLFYFDDSLVKKDESTFLMDFSINDIKYKDSIRNLILTNKIKILTDNYKEWRKFDIIHNNNVHKAKFKLHGSSPTPYRAGYENYTIKSKFPINGYYNFKLITGIEFNYFNIFSNFLAKKFDLISEDDGDIVITNLNGKLRDFHQYEIFDSNYIKKQFNIDSSLIIRRNTFDNKTPNWHSSNLDHVSYNIDLNSISKINYDLWTSFLNNPTKNQYDPNYIGRFIALLQFFGHPHQITGNNDKWIIYDNKIFPVFRNEGTVAIINFNEINDNLFFDKYDNSYSYEPYKKMLTDSDVLYHRNLTFQKIIDEKSIIKNYLDSIYNVHFKKHRQYNDNFIKIKHAKKGYSNVFDLNFSAIENYLNSGHLVIKYSNKTLKLSSSRKNLLKIEVGDKYFDYYPFKKNEQISDFDFKVNEYIINNISSIDSLKIKDQVTNKYLEIEKDYNIIIVN